MKLDFPTWMSAEAQKILSSTLPKNENAYSMYQRVANVLANYGKTQGLPDYETLASDLFYVASQGWLGFSTPIVANAGTNRGLPVSCFGSHIPDSVPGIYDHLKELAVMSQNGGGLGAYFGDVRPGGSTISRGGKSSSVLNWMLQFDSMASKVSQNNTRRGAIAVYLPVDHPDLPEVLTAKEMVDGDFRLKLDCNVGVMITDKFMEDVFVNKHKPSQELFGRILKSREESGSPYLVFRDTINRTRPQAYINNNLMVSTSQLCSEITLYTDADHSFTCVLSSLNIDKYDQWKDWIGQSGFTLPALTIIFLDAINQEFIDRSLDIDQRHSDNSFQRARNGAIKGRPLGLGVMGLGSYFQRRMVPFGSPMAKDLDVEIFSFMKSEAIKGSQFLAEHLGEPEWCKGTGMRNTHLLANAPTMTNSVLAGANSAGVEPPVFNYYSVSGEKSTFVRINTALDDYLKATNRQHLWPLIKAQPEGSIQNLPMFTDHEKLVFRTAYEVDQIQLIEHQALREPFVCQATSFNLFNNPDTSSKDYALQVFKAWKLGVKSMYYNRSSSGLKKVAQNSDMFDHLAKQKILIQTRPDCPYCIKAKALLDSRKLSYEELLQPTGTVPMIFINGNLIGGYSELAQLYGQTEPNSSECVACEG